MLKRKGRSISEVKFTNENTLCKEVPKPNSREEHRYEGINK